MVPLLVIGGYLGAGKTTLINHLLRHAQGRRVAVLVNDFGAINIDADLIEGAEAGVLALSGGCVCCTFGDDLLGGLQRVAQRSPTPDVIVLECSGVGLPGAVARSAALCLAVRVQGVAVVADSTQLQRLAQDRYVGDTVRQQLAQADLLLLNQQDLCTAEQAAALDAFLASVAPDLPLVPCERGRVAPELLLDWQASLHESASLPPAKSAEPAGWRPSGARYQPPPGAAGLFRFHTHGVHAPCDPMALAAELRDRYPGLVRAKGSVHGLDGRVWRVQLMGARVEITVQDHPSASTGSLLCICVGETSPTGPSERPLP